MAGLRCAARVGVDLAIGSRAGRRRRCAGRSRSLGRRDNSAPRILSSGPPALATAAARAPFLSAAPKRRARRERVSLLAALRARCTPEPRARARPRRCHRRPGASKRVRSLSAGPSHGRAIGCIATGGGCAPDQRVALSSCCAGVYFARVSRGRATWRLRCLRPYVAAPRLLRMQLRTSGLKGSDSSVTFAVHGRSRRACPSRYAPTGPYRCRPTLR
jgi:hypothetical protein